MRETDLTKVSSHLNTTTLCGYTARALYSPAKYSKEKQKNKYGVVLLPPIFVFFFALCYSVLTETLSLTMDSYAPLLERTKVPQPSLQKFAVISIFSKLRSAPKHLDSESEPGRDAISQCLHSASPPVVDQSVRELCRLVTEANYGVSRALLELQSALEGSDPNLVNLFVKAIGFLVRFEFQRSNGAWRFSSAETHPFVKVSERNDTSLSPCLVAQNKILISHCVGFGTVIIIIFYFITEILDYLQIIGR